MPKPEVEILKASMEKAIGTNEFPAPDIKVAMANKQKLRFDGKLFVFILILMFNSGYY